MTDETILPCPWCGKPPRLACWPARIFDAVPARDMVTCENEGDDSHPRCPLEGSFMELAAWNRRAPSGAAPVASDRERLLKIFQEHLDLDGHVLEQDPDAGGRYVRALRGTRRILAAGFRAPRDGASPSVAASGSTGAPSDFEQSVRKIVRTAMEGLAATEGGEQEIVAEAFDEIRALMQAGAK